MLFCLFCHKLLWYVSDAVCRLHAHKTDGDIGLSTDHFLHAGVDLHSHVAFCLPVLCYMADGCVPADFACSTILPIPKKINANCSDSENYRGIAMSSVFCKIFDNIVPDKFHDILVTFELQFGFKRNSSTNMCTMILNIQAA